jgi:hypothetical protein
MYSRGLLTVTWAASVLLVAATILSAQTSAQPATTEERDGLAAWAKISAVLTHPRCLNCHQLNTPLQGDMRRIHIPAVVRGMDDKGAGSMRCHNCHNASGNNEMAGVPGAPHWQLAPVSMLWQGLSTGDLCRMLQDETRNGKKNPDDLVRHMDADHLVLWGWEPGGKRQPVSLPHGEFIQQMKIWAAAKTPCPS